MCNIGFSSQIQRARAKITLSMYLAVAGAEAIRRLASWNFEQQRERDEEKKRAMQERQDEGEKED